MGGWGGEPLEAGAEASRGSLRDASTPALAVHPPAPWSWQRLCPTSRLLLLLTVLCSLLALAVVLLGVKSECWAPGGRGRSLWGSRGGVGRAGLRIPHGGGNEWGGAVQRKGSGGGEPGSFRVMGRGLCGHEPRKWPPRAESLARSRTAPTREQQL